MLKGIWKAIINEGPSKGLFSHYPVSCELWMVTSKGMKVSGYNYEQIWNKVWQVQRSYFLKVHKGICDAALVACSNADSIVKHDHKLKSIIQIKKRI